LSSIALSVCSHASFLYTGNMWSRCSCIIWAKNIWNPFKIEPEKCQVIQWPGVIQWPVHNCSVATARRGAASARLQRLLDNFGFGTKPNRLKGNGYGWLRFGYGLAAVYVQIRKGRFGRDIATTKRPLITQYIAPRPWKSPREWNLPWIKCQQEASLWCCHVSIASC